ncbi:MAG TPA: hypothetical protein VI911_10445 [Patescibacteria group bacterium]|nr:hypothetical protein [Patescibacteria group bacterium]
MINVLEFVYGGELTPNPNRIHIFDLDRDMYEHASFYKDNGDFYQIMKFSDELTYYHFQKMETEISAKRLEGEWWMKITNFKKVYEHRKDVIYEKITDRLVHGYKIASLVIAKGMPISFPSNHPDYKELVEGLKGGIILFK